MTGKNECGKTATSVLPEDDAWHRNLYVENYWILIMAARSFLKLFVKAFLLLRKNDPLILASSTAFFTTFSLSPIIIILAKALSISFQRNTFTA
jgi:hypothetical protein